jgi:hypothetical protein
MPPSSSLKRDTNPTNSSKPEDTDDHLIPSFLLESSSGRRRRGLPPSSSSVNGVNGSSGFGTSSSQSGTASSGLGFLSFGTSNNSLKNGTRTSVSLNLNCIRLIFLSRQPKKPWKRRSWSQQLIW